MSYIGKTIAFVIGMLAKINLSQPFPQALCLTPTRELANQILSDAVRPLSSRLRVTYEEALPGRDIAPGSVCNSQVRAIPVLRTVFCLLCVFVCISIRHHIAVLMLITSSIGEDFLMSTPSSFLS
jgi:superfamily II DNA/RNA helicase